MNKTFSLMILSLMVIGMLGVVSAEGLTTVIAGKIYNADYTNVISGATVTVTCGTTTLPTVESIADGSYKVQFTDGLCTAGKELTVSAVSGSLTGSKTGTVKTTECTGADNCLVSITDDFDVAVVNVPLVPEFGLIAGLTTVLGALGVFFVVRRK